MSTLSDYAVKAGTKHRLFNIHVLLTYNCNINCVHCYLENAHSPGIDWRLLKDTLIQARELGTFSVTFSGGEPFVYKHWRDAVALARRLHMAVRFISNGTLIDEEVARDLARLKVLQVDVSLFSLEPSIHDQMAQVQGSHARTMKAIALLMQHGVPVGIKTTITRLNYDTYTELEAWARDRSIRATYDIIVTPKLYEESQRHIELSLPFEKKVEFIRERKERRISKEILEREKDDSSLIPNEELEKGAVRCGAARFSFLLTPLGEIMPCVEWQLVCGNIHEQTLEDIWNNSPQFKMIRSARRSDLKYCNTCEYEDSCMHCPALIHQETGDFLGCSPLVKEKAMVFHKADISAKGGNSR